MARFYSNENFPRRAVEALREIAHDVLTSYEAGRANQQIDDHDVSGICNRGATDFTDGEPQGFLSRAPLWEVETRRDRCLHARSESRSFGSKYSRCGKGSRILRGETPQGDAQELLEDREKKNLTSKLADSPVSQSLIRSASGPAWQRNCRG